MITAHSGTVPWFVTGGCAVPSPKGQPGIGEMATIRYTHAPLTTRLTKSSNDRRRFGRPVSAGAPAAERTPTMFGCLP